jgi:carbonic anhydrase/acetyltransferase-like protein (isoleucine patch superfamily)
MAYIREIRGHTPQVGENTFLAETAVLVGDVTAATVRSGTTPCYAAM